MLGEVEVDNKQEATKKLRDQREEGEEGLDKDEAERIESQANTNAASRAIAVMILMLLPGVAGSYLDKWLSTQFFVVIGFGVGIVIAIFGLLYVAKIADVAAKKSRKLRERNASNLDGTQND